ncbi:hypothetical protein SLITO_v1c08230 [Spiroplasma litorale]|uniref:Lipoprotein n=1 Tax=Spiroplasma litorale TaxID=216942 RepID=A0A0K1W284_9MOLU|nr:hypothetical protein [Spiroplasma litorale]AKX34440.1 hypothetical protein SLITO_v1c08230 [Spiroplasma litorale]
MKKIIRLSTAFMFIPSVTSIVVACDVLNKINPQKPETDPQKPVEPGTNPQEEFKKLVEEYKKELQEKINEHFRNISANLFELESDKNPAKYDFINLANIKKMTNGGINVSGFNLTSDQQQQLINDSKKAIEFNDSLKKSLLEVTRQEKYVELNIPGYDIKIDYLSTFNNLIMTYNENIQTTIISGTVNYGFQLSIAYLDYDKSENYIKFDENFKFSLTSSDKISESMTMIYNKFIYEALTEYELTNLINTNNSYLSSDKLERFYKDYFNNNKISFQEKLIKTLNENYNKLNNNPEAEVKFVIKKNMEDKVFTKSQTLENLSATNVKIHWKNNKDLYDNIFRTKILVNDETEIINDKRTQVNKNIYSFIKNNFLNYNKNYFNKNVETIKKYKSDFEYSDLEKNKNLYTSSHLLNIILSNIQLQIGDFYQDLPDLNLLSNLSYKKDENENYNLSNQSSGEDLFDKGNAFWVVYQNLVDGLSGFKDGFGIREYSSGNQYYEQYKDLNLVAFTGGEKDSYNQNLWGRIYDQSKINAYLNEALTNNIKEYVTTKSNQDKWLWEMPFDEVKFKDIPAPSGWGYDYKGVEYKYGSWYDNVKNYKKIMKFQQNFINLDIEIDTIFGDANNAKTQGEKWNYYIPILYVE